MRGSGDRVDEDEPAWHLERRETLAEEVAERSLGHRFAHDHCGCATEPVYGEDWTPPARTQRFAEMYAQSTSDATGADKVKAFRRAYEGRA